MSTCWFSQEEPYMMLKKEENGEILKGNDKYEGFCKDLLERISETLGIQCESSYVNSNSTFPI